MSHHAKTSSARSTSGQSASLGSFVRGAFSIRGVSGSGARWISALALVALALSALFASLASAAQTRPNTGISFGPDGVGGSELFSNTQSLAVDPANDDVYVYDGGAGRIYKFDAAGTPVDFSSTGTNFIEGVGGSHSENIENQIAVAPPGSPGGTAGDIYVANSSNFIHIYGSDGSELHEPLETGGETCGVATDPSGNLYVGINPATIQKFTPSANPPVKADKDATEGIVSQNICNVAADGLGNVYAANYTHHGVFKLEGLSDPEPTEVDPEAKGIAIDPSSNELYADFSTTELLTGSALVQFDPAGTLVAASEAPDARGVAVPAGGSKTYVSTATTVEILGALENVEAPTVELEPPTGITGSSVHLSGHINPNAPAGNPHTYNVTYSFVCTPSCGTSGLSGNISADATSHLVEATPSGLKPDTTYQVYLTAHNVVEAERSPKPPTPPFEFTTKAVAPTIEEQKATKISTSEANFSAVVNPGGTEATYQFQYVTRAQYEAAEFAGAQETPESILAVGASGVPVSAVVTGLTPSTGYVFRAVATNTIEGSTETTFGEPIAFTTQEPSLLPEEGCANEAFRTDESAFLPDCRAYEQVSPVYKNGGGIEGEPGVLQASESGDDVTFFTQSGIPGGVGAQDYPTYLSSRGNDSWITQGLLPPQALGELGVFLGLTPDNRYAVTEATLEASETGVFVRDLRDGSMSTVVRYQAYCDNCFQLAGASVDGSKIFIEAPVPLTGQTPAGQPNVYVWDRASGEVQLADVQNPDEASSEPVPLEEGGFAGPYDWPQERLSEGGSQAEQSSMYVGAIHAISADGSQLVFTSREGEGGFGGGGQIYLRQNPSKPQSPIGSGGECTVSANACTIQVSAPEPGASGEGTPAAAFLEATPDGGHIFFMSKRELTSDAYSGPAGKKTQSLYRYDVAAGNLVDLTPDEGQTHEAGPGVDGFLGAAESGRSAYFVANAVLTTAAGPGGAEPVQGEDNLYHYEEGASPPLSFVATLEHGLTYGEGDIGNWSAFQTDPVSTGGGVAKTARVSAGGQSVVFSSVRALTKANNRSVGSGCRDNNGRCAEFFRYTAGDGALGCLSCNPTGEGPLGGATIGTAFINAVDATRSYASPFLARNLSANGDRFFFQTPDPLVAADVNARSGCTFSIADSAPCLDVYEWEASGTGSCSHAIVNGGCLSLISTGKEREPSYFVDADREGDDAFILTASQLVPADRDRLYDVYDASQGGGLASQHQEPAVRCSSQQACQGPAVSPEPLATPGSSTLVGPGNRIPSKCQKGSKKCKHKHKKKKHKKKDAKKRAGRGQGGTK